MGVTPEELAALSRDDLEKALAYHQPRAFAFKQELDAIKQNEKLLSKMRFWRRLRWAITKK